MRKPKDIEAKDGEELIVTVGQFRKLLRGQRATDQLVFLMVVEDELSGAREELRAAAAVKSGGGRTSVTLTSTIPDEEEIPNIEFRDYAFWRMNKRGMWVATSPVTLSAAQHMRLNAYRRKNFYVCMTRINPNLPPQKLPYNGPISWDGDRYNYHTSKQEKARA